MSRMFLTAELGVWKPVPDFPGYMVSKDGQVLSVQRGYGWIMSLIRYKRTGHLYVFLYRDRHMCKRYIHDLVLIAWHRKPVSGEECRHFNGNPEDNRLENLAWGTRQDNADDRVKHGRSPYGENSPMHKLTEAQVLDIRTRVATTSLRSLAREFGVSHTCIRRAANGMNWSYL